LIGSYHIASILPAGWMQTLPDSGYFINLLHDVDSNGNNFGQFKLGTIHGVVFYDENQNRILDGNEQGLPGWIISLSGLNSYNTYSDSTGNFIFSHIPPGTYTLAESSQIRWLQTLPNNNGTYTITIASGLDSGNLFFGNFYITDSTYQISAGWNLLSLPEKITDHTPKTIYPTAASAPFIYRSGYVALDSIPEKTGFWLKSDVTQYVDINGTPRLLDTIDVVTGWNMIGGLSVPISVDSIIQIPENNVSSDYFKYETTYVADSILVPMHGYWVKVKETGKLILNGLTITGSAKRK